MGREKSRERERGGKGEFESKEIRKRDPPERDHDCDRSMPADEGGPLGACSTTTLSRILPQHQVTTFFLHQIVTFNCS